MIRFTCLLVLLLMSASTPVMAELQVPAGVTVEVVIDSIPNPRDLAYIGRRKRRHGFGKQERARVY